MKLLAIESSCDETAASVVEITDDRQIRLITNIVSSQVAIHAQYGGVVPEVAARNHVMTMLPVLREALGDARPDAIAVTGGPGLVTSLLVGVETARALSYVWGVPLLRTSHLAGHIYANLFELTAPVEYPAMALLVSGGHTELVLMPEEGVFQVVGATRDDAVGEVYDKVGKMLSLGYPGGPIVSKHAAQGNVKAFDFPRPMLDSGSFEFSFSGLKTAVRYAIRDYDLSVDDICASFQQAVIDVLIAKTLRAARELDVRTVLFGGGVMANPALREQMSTALDQKLPGVLYQMPSLQVCTDNAAMIAAAAAVQLWRGEVGDWHSVTADPGWEFDRV